MNIRHVEVRIKSPKRVRNTLIQRGDEFRYISDFLFINRYNWEQEACLP